MKEATPGTIYLKEYSPPHYTIDQVSLTFELDDIRTKVSSSLEIRRLDHRPSPLILNARDLELESIVVDGHPWPKHKYEIKAEQIIIHDVPESFELEMVNWIAPASNTALEGLYKSGGIFCTQNEPEGMRRIVPFIDRPDVMAKYEVKLIADEKLYPILLSNGNLLSHGKLPNGQHFAHWQDPHAKPAYLFALVAGDLGMVRGDFETSSGRKVDLRVYCDKGNEYKCHHALESLKKSMKWDEDTYGLEYDLDIYMIVAVDAFNMGAMENKGLNIFNSAYVLANPKTATDQNFLAIEAVVAHEYFHNWTGNRVTCRDWFQLTLKEGLTVFRDQEFSSDLNSRAVKRIEDVRLLRSRQFPEDQGPNAHPIRPDSYIEINNFYTPTVYEKGSEVIRMIHTMLGKQGFRRGMDKYFELYDGKAVTTEDFLHAMSVANGHFDFGQFKKWYDQAATPDVHVRPVWDEKSATLTVEIKQSCRPTKECQQKKPFHFPFALDLLDQDGRSMPMHLQSTSSQPDINRGVLHVRTTQETFRFTGLPQKPVLSLNRAFSAPVRLHCDYRPEELAFLMSKDSDLFNRFEAGQTLMGNLIANGVEKKANDLAQNILIKAWGELLSDRDLGGEFLSMALCPPELEVLIQSQSTYLIEQTESVRQTMLNQMMAAHSSTVFERYEECHESGEYRLTQESIGKRSLKNTLLNLMASSKHSSASPFAWHQFSDASNMTDQIGSLRALIHHCELKGEEASARFYQQWKHEGLVIQKWFSLWAMMPHDNVIEKIRLLEKDPAFNIKIPNFVRSLYRVFMNNLPQFHRADGKGYELVGEKILEIDRMNPHIASGLAKGFSYYGRLPQQQKDHMRKVLTQIADTNGLSRDTFEIVTNTLNS